MPRPVCSECAKKHLAQASILLDESKKGYPKHYFLALGHMAEAEDELIGKYKKEAGKIRDERKKLEHNPEYKLDFLGLIDMVDKYCSVCELEHGHNPGPIHRKYLPHGLTEEEKADPYLRRKLSRCIKKVEKKQCPKGFKSYDECTANPVAVCRASVKK